jgi:hypothetical protein
MMLPKKFEQKRVDRSIQTGIEQPQTPITYFSEIKSPDQVAHKMATLQHSLLKKVD